MKKNLLVAFVAMVLILLVSACSGGVETTPLPTGSLPEASNPEQPDNVVSTPGGLAYRANLHDGINENPWPPIDFTAGIMGEGDDTLTARFRAGMETAAGETRNQIIIITAERENALSDSELELYTIDLPGGITLTDCGHDIYLPGTLSALVTIATSSGIAPGTYTVNIGIKVDGKDYGMLPCTVTVMS